MQLVFTAYPFFFLCLYMHKKCIFPGETLSSDLRFRRKGEIKKVPLKYEIRNLQKRIEEKILQDDVSLILKNSEINYQQ